MPPGKIFISYTRSDKATVDPYVEALRAESLDHWIDRSEIEPGSDIIEQINAGLHTCPNAVIFYSASYVGNAFAVREMNTLTLANLTIADKNLVIVRVDDTPLPALLSSLSWVWAGSPAQLAKVFSSRLPEEVHRASLAVGLSRSDAPPIDVFLDRLSTPSVEQLAKACADHLDRAGYLDRMTRFPAIVNGVELTLGVRDKPPELLADDMRGELQQCAHHRFFVNDYKRMLSAMGAEQMAAATFRLGLLDRIKTLEASRSALRGFLKALLVNIA